MLSHVMEPCPGGGLLFMSLNTTHEEVSILRMALRIRSDIMSSVDKIRNGYFSLLASNRGFFIYFLCSSASRMPAPQIGSNATRTIHGQQSRKYNWSISCHKPDRNCRLVPAGKSLPMFRYKSVPTSAMSRLPSKLCQTVPFSALTIFWTYDERNDPCLPVEGSRGISNRI